MSEPIYHVTGIGNAIVDILAQVPESFLTKHNLVKGSMALIDQQMAEALYETIPQAVEASGGSAANTIAGISSLGGKTAYIGKVKNDQLGGIFAHDIRSLGVHFDTDYAEAGASTARCFVVITPDAQRTMSTYLGVAGNITNDDMDAEVIASSRLIYIEGYLWDEPTTIKAIKHAISISKKHHRQVAFSLSDSFCVDRHRDEFLELIASDIDILFANESEIIALFECPFDEAVKQLQQLGKLAALTRGASGSLIVTANETYKIAPIPTKVVDTTGAGDLYAAGFLYGYTQNLPLPECGRLGSVAAAEIISHIGARPQQTLKELV